MKTEGTLGIALLLASFLIPGVALGQVNVGGCGQSVNFGGTALGLSQTHTAINATGETWVALRWCLGISCPSQGCVNHFINYTGPGVGQISGANNEIFVTGLNIPPGGSYTATLTHGGAYTSCVVFLDPVCVSEAPSTVGEASKQQEPPDLMLPSWDPVAGMIDVSYMPACGAVGHNIYFGALSDVGTYGWSGVECSVGTSGVTSFDPLLDDVFFLIVGEDGTFEGSYGRDSTGVERPEDMGAAVCERPQDLSNSCSN